MPVTVNGLPLDAGPVFVLGAGFTRAVCPEALLENDFEVKWLLERFRSHRTARKLLGWGSQQPRRHDQPGALDDAAAWGNAVRCESACNRGVV